MSGPMCRHCNGRIDVLKAGRGKPMAREMDLPFLVAVPFDPGPVHSYRGG